MYERVTVFFQSICRETHFFGQKISLGTRFPRTLVIFFLSQMTEAHNRNINQTQSFFSPCLLTHTDDARFIRSFSARNVAPYFRSKCASSAFVIVIKMGLV